MSRRAVVETLALAGAMLMLETACANPARSDTSKDKLLAPTPYSKTVGAAQNPQQTVSVGTLTGRLTPELIRRFNMQHLADVPTTIHQIPVSDQKPTYIYLYDQSTGLNVDGAKSAYEAVSPAGLSRYTEALRKDKNTSEYRPDPTAPGSSVFRYDYGVNNEPPVDIGIYTASSITRERHLLVLNGKDVPDWARNAGAITRHHILPGSGIDNSGVLFTVISPTDFRKHNADIDVQLNRAVLTEICQQTVLALGFVGDRVAKPQEMESTISQEGFCNGFGWAATLRRLGIPADEAPKGVSSTIIAGINGSPNMRLFAPTRSAYSLLPDNGPVVGTR